MKYDEFKAILDQHILGGTPEELLVRITKHPERFVGLFRPSTPRDKIIQNLIQAREIRFGNAMEEVFRQILRSSGYEYLRDPSRNLAYDHLCLDRTGNKVIIIEQKVRDDHDSSKRRGQFDNFKRKVEAVIKVYPNKEIHAIMYFLDPELKKNQNFYQQEVNKMAEEINKTYQSKVKAFLLYGEEIFLHLHQIYPLVISWGELLEWLKAWKNSLHSIRENLDFSEDAVMQIAKTKPDLILELANHESLWDEGLIREIFGDAKVLKVACRKLSRAKGISGKWEKLNKLKEMIERYYGGDL